MGIERVVVCDVQVPFVRGGAEAHARALARHLREAGYQTELVSVPFKWYPKEEILAHAAAWRLLDLSESNGQSIDLVIALKFPSYFARHPNKVAWVIHQYRAAYELCGTPFSDFEHVEADVGLRDRLVRLDTAMLKECRRVFTNSQNVARRLARHNGIAAEPVYHPPTLAGALHAGPFGDYVLSVGRLEAIKRVELAIQALAEVPPPLRLVVTGEGSHRPHVERAAETAGVADRVDFVGTVSDEQLVELYAGALAVVFVPFDEDYGYVTLEAFLARKPVVTTTDAGGPLEFVVDGVNGLVCEPAPGAIAGALARLAADRAWAKALGEAGFERARAVTWQGVVEKIVAAGL
jgi:glycosyltransferase involved in cell wall biosynthesis